MAPIETVSAKEYLKFMSLYFRLLKALLMNLFAEKSAGLATQIMSLIVWPSDLDLELHMNNGRYVTIMDLGRVQYYCRTGLLRQIFAKRWKILVGAAQITFKKPLAPFQAYELQTKLISWDEKWIYFEQSFISNETVMAVGYAKVIFRSKAETMSPLEYLGAIGIRSGLPPSPVPDFFLTTDPLA